MNRLIQTESAVFQLCRFIIFPKDPLVRLLSAFLLMYLPVDRYSAVVVFTFSGLLGLLGSECKPLKPMLGDVRFVFSSISHE